jgi:hypothetical protein
MFLIKKDVSDDIGKRILRIFVKKTLPFAKLIIGLLTTIIINIKRLEKNSSKI